MDLCLTPSELSAVVSALRSASNEDAPGGGPLRRAAEKLGTIEGFLSGARFPSERAVSAEKLRHSFALSGQVLEADLSGARLSLSRDVHYGDFELAAEVLGADGPESPVHEGRLSAALDGGRAAGGVGAAFALSVFDPEVLALLAERGAVVAWNEGWETQAAVDPAHPDPDLLLRVEGL